jgi:lysophospholipase L1-like esterase
VGRNCAAIVPADGETHLTIMHMNTPTIVAGLALLLTSSALGAGGTERSASFAEFDRRATVGEALSVVFFGGSLTYGANASDPGVTSYRGRMSQYLREKYPRARWTFHDAAIGGTGSDLGMFRLERDVLAHQPDLVFLDFMANDGYDGTDLETRCCYETLLRRMIGQGIAVEQMYFGFKWQFGKDGYKPEAFTRRTDYQKLAGAYHVAQGDLYPLLQDALISGKVSADTLWPFDGVHPDDPGYEVFFQAARIGFEAAVDQGLVCTVPEQPLFGQMTDVERIRLADRPLPNGWSRAKTYRTSLWFDGLSSRWMGDVALCDVRDAGEIEPLRVEFEGSFLGFFGEASHEGLDFQVKLDGQPFPFDVRNQGQLEAKPDWPFRITYGQGNLFVWRKKITMLPPGKHVLEIVPLIPAGTTKGQLRIESVCVAKYEPQH